MIILFCITCVQNVTSMPNSTDSENSNVLDNYIDTTYFSDELCILSDIDFYLRKDTSSNNSKLLNRLIDCYNASVIMNSLLTDFDLQMRFDFKYEDVVKAVENMDIEQVNDAETLSKLKDYKKEMLYLLTADVDTVDQDVHNPWKSKYELFSYIAEKYNVEAFGEIDEDSYFDVYNNCPTVPEWGELKEKRGRDNMVAELKDKYNNATDFDARCIYAIELAHAYEKDMDAWGEDVYRNPATQIMESLMKENKYSIYLKEMWEKWRVLYQSSEGASKDSEIPNQIYNEYRKLCIKTILSHIKAHPNDIFAINEFLVISSKHNILREGSFPYGNQYAVDKYYLFY